MSACKLNKNISGVDNGSYNPPPNNSSPQIPNSVSTIQLMDVYPSASNSPTIEWQYSSTGNNKNLLRFEYSLGSLSGANDLVDWTSNGTSTTLNLSGLTLTSGNTYYLSIRVIDESGSVSSVSISSWKVVDAVTVDPRFPAAPNWNDYVEASSTSTPCTAASQGYENCLHGGEKKLVDFPSETSCTDLKANDALDVFYWKCEEGANVVFKTFEVKPGRGLKNLLSATDWKNNYVVITKNDVPIAASLPDKWWSNPVEALPDNSTTSVIALNDPSKIYVLAQSRETFGYNMNADKAAIVVLPGAVLKLNASAIANYSFATGEVGTDGKGLISMGGQKYNWFEGNFDNLALSGTVFNFKSGSYSVFNNLNTLNGHTAFNLGNPNSSLFKNIRSTYFLSYGFAMDNAVTNTFQNVFMNSPSGSSTGMYFGDFSSDNRILNLTTTTFSSGVNFFTTTGNSFIGTRITQSASGIKNFSTFKNLFLNLNVNSLGNVIDNWDGNGTSSPTFAQAVLKGLNYYTMNAMNMKFTKFLSLDVSGCNVTGGSNVGINASCALVAPSNATLVGPLDTSNSEVGKITIDDTSNSQDDPVNGVAYEDITDWYNFDSPYRYWGNSTGVPCSTSTTCYIHDLRPKANDLVIKNTTGTFTSQNEDFPTDPTQNCPSAVDGSNTTTDQFFTPRTFLTNAFEIINDEIGNDNGVCESNEACVYMPNIGSYQGEGNFYERSCLFQDGTVSGVTLYAFPEN